MRSLRVSTLLFAVSLAACSSAPSDSDSAEQAANGPDGMQWVTATVTNPKCRSVVLRGTQKYRGRAFVMPQAYVAVDDNERPLFHTMKNPAGGWITRIGLLFPAGNHGGRQQVAAFRSEPDCTYDEIRDSLNSYLPEADKIVYPEPLLVSHITAQLQGVDDTAMIGTPENDVLSYAGSDTILEFKIPNDEQLALFLERIRKGIQLNVSFAFAVRASDGFANVKVNFKEVSDKLDAAFSSQLGAGVRDPSSGVSAKLVSQREFKMKLAQVLSTISIEGYVEDSSDDGFDALAQKIVDKVAEISPQAIIKPDAAPTGEEQPLTPIAAPEPEVPAQPSQPQPPPAEGTQPSEGTAPTGDSAAPSTPSMSVAVEARVNAKLAIESMRKLGTYEMRLERMTQLEKHQYTTWAIIRAPYNQAGVESVQPRSWEDGASLGQDVKKGSLVSIAPYGRTVQKLTYSMVPTYFETKKELGADEHKMRARFPLLRDYWSWLGEPKGEPVYMYDESGWKIYTWLSNWSYHEWGYETLDVQTSEKEFERMGAKQFQEYLKAIKVEFSSASSRLYSLEELGRASIANGAPVDGVVRPDELKIEFVAGRDLGRMKIFNKDEEKPEFALTETVYKKRYFERHMGGYGRGQLKVTYSDWEKPSKKPSQQSEYYVRVMGGDTLSLFGDRNFSPAAGVAPASLEDIEVRSKDGVLRQPPKKTAPPKPAPNEPAPREP